MSSSSPAPPLQVGIYGCGAIGMYVGAVLQKRSNCSVMYLVRSSRLKESIEQDPMKSLNIIPMEDDPFSIPLSELDITTDARRMKKCNIILVTVKSTDTEVVGTKLSGILPMDSDTIIISLQNGVPNATTLRSILPNRRVLAGVVGFNVCNVNSTFTQTSTGTLHIEQSKPTVNYGSAYTRTQRENRFVSILTSTAPALPKTHHDPSIEQTQYGKLLINLANAPIALSGRPIKEFLLNPYYRLVWAKCISEALIVYHAANIKASATAVKIPPFLVPHILRLSNQWYLIVARSVTKIDPKAKPSMLQDLESGRYQTEIDVLQGEIVALGKKYNIQTPVNEMIQREMKSACERQIGSPNLNADELLFRAGITEETSSLWYDVVPWLVVGTFLGTMIIAMMKILSIFA